MSGSVPTGWGGAAESGLPIGDWGAPETTGPAPEEPLRIEELPVGWQDPPPSVDPEEPPGWVDPLPVETEEPPRVLRGEQGPEGPPGPVGGRLLKLAHGPLSGGRVVRLIEEGQHIRAVSALDAVDAAGIAGISAQSAALRDEEVEVIRFGELEDDSWNFVPFRHVFAGPSGELTQTVNAATWAFVCVVGTAVAPTKVLIDIRAPTFLAR